MRTRHFRDLLVWQKAMFLTKEVYRYTATLPKSEIFGLQSQMRRAAVSIPSNIAEGHGRLSDHLLRVFLAQARGSLYELETQIQLCHDLDFIPPDAVKDLFELCNEVARMINGLLKTLKPKDIKQHAS
ncbi:four helix bundle protein [Tunturibacter empetritectus]|uniref:four helix bundle protein n=2 Tax=Tunturiibacter empetritectus TaxID=3069691 RepID=UPI0016165284|nr:four helix bundle protein [Edaphobacter lichenicola]